MANRRMNRDKWDLISYFKPAEFACPCGKCKNDGTNMSYDLLVTIDDFRDVINQPVSVTSGQRCEEYNNSLEGSIQDSDHLTGDAADITCAYFKSKDARYIAMKMLMQEGHVNYCYCDGYYMKGSTVKKFNAPWMVNSIHISVVK